MIIPRANGVLGPHCNLRTKGVFFYFNLRPKHEAFNQRRTYSTDRDDEISLLSHGFGRGQTLNDSSQVKTCRQR